MNISFKEKSILTSLIITILIFGYYFIYIFRAMNDPNPNESELIGFFFRMVVLMIIIEIASHITLAIAFKKEANEGYDERDKIIELKAIKISYWILILGVLITGVNIIIEISPLISANILWLIFIIAEITGDTIKLFYYKRGI